MIVVGGAGNRQGRPHRGAKLTALEPVANCPIVVHALDRLSEDTDCDFIFAGAADDLIDLRAILSEHAYGQDRVAYVVADPSVGLIGALRAVAPVVGETPCLVQPADGLLDDSVLPLAEVLELESAELLLAVATQRANRYPWREAVYDDVCEDDVHVVEAGLFAAGALARVTRRGAPASSDLAGIGRHMSGAGLTVLERPVDSWYRYTGHGGDLLELNRVVLDRVTREVPGPLLAGNRIEGNVRIDPTASVTASVILGPTVIGPGAAISNAYIGPYTSVGAGARVEGAEIERAIVSPEASVMNVGPRLTSSLVGRGTRVFNDFSLPRAVRLWVGEDDDVALC